MAWHIFIFRFMFIFGFLVSDISLEDVLQTDLEEVKSVIYDGLIKYQQSGKTVPLLQRAVNRLRIPPRVFSTKQNAATTNDNICTGCAAAFKYFLLQSRLGADRETLVKMGLFTCTLFKIESERVCRGIIDLNIDTLSYIAKEKTNLTEKHVCAIIFQSNGCFKDYRSTWSVYIPPATNSEEISNENKASDNFYRVLHLTDIHVDSLYQPGANAKCGEPLCCQNDQGNSSDLENAAGTWGDYRNCDMPYHALINMLEQIKMQQEQLNPGFSYVYFTGDIISHRVWDTSKDSNTQEIKKTYKLFKEVFGEVPVFPILGNHESHPVNVFSPPTVTNEILSTQWVFDLVAEEWSVWLPKETQDTIRYGGYYTVVVKPGFRIIALNSNVCYTYNWWLLYEDYDPFDQLHWLSVILAKAEAQNEVVHILSHVPPGDQDCLYECSRQFRKIIHRFSNIIKAQFNGHTHLDELRIFYDYDSLQPVNIAFNGGSFTTFTNLNPNYRFYSVNSERHEVLDFEEWTYNLKEANTHPDRSPDWYKLYSFKDAYGLESMELKNIDNLIKQMTVNTSLLELYQRFKIRDAEPLMLEGCDNECFRQNLCSIVTTEVDDKTMCNILLSNNSITL